MSWVTTPLVAMFNMIKGIFTFKTVKAVGGVIEDADKIAQVVGKATSDAARYTAIGDIEDTVQKYGNTLVKDGRTMVILIALSIVFLFIIGLLPRDAYLAMPPIVLEVCRWVEIYLGLSVPTSGALTALNMWSREKLIHKVLDQAHQRAMNPHIDAAGYGDGSGLAAGDKSADDGDDNAK